MQLDEGACKAVALEDCQAVTLEDCKAVATLQRVLTGNLLTFTELTRSHTRVLLEGSYQSHTALTRTQRGGTGLGLQADFPAPFSMCTSSWLRHFHGKFVVAVGGILSLPDFFLLFFVFLLLSLQAAGTVGAVTREGVHMCTRAHTLYKRSRTGS